MKILALSRYALGVCASVAFLVACSSGGSQLAPAATQQSSLDRSQTLSVLRTSATQHLFVANLAAQPTDVTIYGLESNKLLHRIKSEIDTRAALADDTSGRLYVLNSQNGWVTVFGPKKKYVSYIIKGFFEPTALSLDSSGALYVANYAQSNIKVFAPGTKTLSRTITDGVSLPVALVFDESGDLFVANTNDNGDSITMYPPGGSVAIKTITNGVKSPSALATDTKGNLYVVNWQQSGGSVTIYSAGSLSLMRTITDGINTPGSLAFDSSGNLYVGNATNITVYAPGSSKVLRLIATERNGFFTTALTFDSAGVLYAAYEGEDFGGVKLFAPGSNTPMLKIGRPQGVLQPVALAIGL